MRTVIEGIRIASMPPHTINDVIDRLQRDIRVAAKIGATPDEVAQLATGATELLRALETQHGKVAPALTIKAKFDGAVRITIEAPGLPGLTDLEYNAWLRSPGRQFLYEWVRELRGGHVGLPPPPLTSRRDTWENEAGAKPKLRDIFTFSRDQVTAQTWPCGICADCLTVVECGDAMRFEQFRQEPVDYAWRCANAGCRRHVPVATGDQEVPDWVQVTG